MEITLPAYQKFYSALSNLDRFRKENDFFDNISHLDTFFSEFRNITFVLQKSISNNADMKAIYVRLRNKYLINNIYKWLNEKRVEITHERPFELEKQLAITIYKPSSTLALAPKVFTIENDVEFTTLKEPLKAFFTSLKLAEIHFSVEFFYYEKGTTDNLIDQILEAVKIMKIFLNEFQKEIKEECHLCEQIQNKISKLDILKFPKDMLFCVDYLYHYTCKTFKIGAYSIIQHPTMTKRSTLGHFNKSFKKTNNSFNNFIIWHTICFQKQKKIMPTFMIIYEDDTFMFESFGFSIRTTLYRKINTISKRVKDEGIKAIYFVSESYVYEKNTYNTLLPYDKRIKNSTKEILSFYMIDNQLQNISKKFETNKIDSFEYIASVLNSPKQDDELTPIFLNPIMKTFRDMQLSSTME